MNNFKHLFCITALMFFYSCIDNKEYGKIKQSDYELIIIDSCEYIFMSDMPNRGYIGLSHKGNCKFCKKQNNK